VDEFCSNSWPLAFFSVTIPSLSDCVVEILCCFSTDNKFYKGIVPDDIVAVFMNRFLFIIAKSGKWEYYQGMLVIF
jgi:hypothetical protein